MSSAYGCLIAILEDITPTNADIDEHPELDRLSENASSRITSTSAKATSPSTAGLFEVVERRWLRH